MPALETRVTISVGGSEGGRVDLQQNRCMMGGEMQTGGAADHQADQLSEEKEQVCASLLITLIFDASV